MEIAKNIKPDTIKVKRVKKERTPLTPEQHAELLDERGKFRKGHSGVPGAGRPSKKAEQLEYLHALQEGMPPTMLLNLWEEAIASAKLHAKTYKTPKQLFKAIEMMMQYGYGKPQQSIMIETDDLVRNLRELIADPVDTEELPYIDGHFVEEVEVDERDT